MYKKYFEWVFRRFIRSRVYTGIAVGGLVIALTVVLSVYGYLVKEQQTDRFHKNESSLYRVTAQIAGYDSWTTQFCSPLAENAVKEIPGVKDFVRLVAPQTFLVKGEGEFLPEGNCIYTDPQFFNLLSFPLVAGQVERDMPPAWAVVSERLAQKYFGKESALGKILTLKYPDRLEAMEYRVVAVMKDFPARSSLFADLLLDFGQVENAYSYGAGNALTVLLQLEPGADPIAIEKAIPEMEGRYSEEERQMNKTVRLQPLTDIYLHSAHIRDYEDVFRYGALRFNWILGGIAWLVLLLAAANYLMIRIAQLQKGAAVFAVQRCFGAGNRSIGWQLVTEIAVHMFVAASVAIGLYFILHPYFSELISPQYPYPCGLRAWEWGGFTLLVAGVTLGMGGVLTLGLLWRLRRCGIRQTIKRESGRLELKQILLVGQMCIFGGLLFASFMLLKQMNFIRNKPLGYDNHCVLCVEWPGNKTGMGQASEEWLGNPDIVGVSNGRPLPIGNWRTYEVSVADYPERKVKSSALLGDTSYLNTYRIRLLEGRNYRKRKTESSNSGPVQGGEVVINREMAKELGLQHPVGTILDYGPSLLQVVGVVEDFHYESLYQTVKPVIIGADLMGSDNNLSIRYREGRRQAVVSYLRQFYRDNFAGVLFRTTAYDYSDLYARDEALVRMIGVLTLLAIWIAATGVFAFSMFVAESRTKEVAVRKINGATEMEVIRLLSRGFVLRISVACLLSIPLAFYGVEQWLQGFAYRTSAEWWIFVADIFVSVGVVLSVSTWQLWRAATINPVKALKTD